MALKRRQDRNTKMKVMTEWVRRSVAYARVYPIFYKQ